jgi:hypothetical protein
MTKPENEKNENLTIKDVVVLSTVATATVMAVGGLARLGYDLAGEGIAIYRARKAVKNAEKESPK